MNIRKTVVALLALCAANAFASDVVDLSGTWRLSLATNAAETCAVEVPGDVHTALFAAGRIPDPYRGCNETNVQWAAKEDWAFARSFDVAPELLARKRVVLEIEDADTFADVYLNGVKVAETFATREQILARAPEFEWHQKNPGGNRRIRETMTRYFRPVKDVPSELLLSQFQQGMAIKMAVDGWRAQRPRCMGTLFWQLNDDVAAFARPADGAEPTFLVLTLKVGGKAVCQNDWHFGFYKDMPLAAAKVEARLSPSGELALTTDKPAFFVWANAKGVRGEFDDNCLTLLPGRPRTLKFSASLPSASLSVTHLAELTTK